MRQVSSTSDLVLVVEDDDLTRDGLRALLAGEGFTVDVACDGDEMRTRMEERVPRVVLMDVRLPGEDGFELTRYLRAHYEVGVIILTTKTELIDRVVGLEIGADDYVTKPYEPRELMARIRSLMRRMGASEGPLGAAEKSADGVSASNRRIELPGGVFDATSRKLIGAEGESADLTSSEIKALRALADNRQSPISRASLMKTIFNRDWDPTDRSVDVLVAKLRKKISDVMGDKTAIRSVRGVGYELSVDESEMDAHKNPTSRQSPAAE